jgi:hypothetical protein
MDKHSEEYNKGFQEATELILNKLLDEANTVDLYFGSDAESAFTDIVLKCCGKPYTEEWRNLYPY